MEENEESWKGIPGHFDIDVARKNNFFSVKNPDEVIYQGKKPVFEQYGPYIYREYQVFEDVRYDQDLQITGLKNADFK